MLTDSCSHNRGATSRISFASVAGWGLGSGQPLYDRQREPDNAGESPHRGHLLTSASYGPGQTEL